AFGVGGQPVVQPSGPVIVPAFDPFRDHFIVFRSPDGGAHWSPRHRLAKLISHHTSRTGLRDAAGLPSAEVAGSGKIYVVWPDCRFRSRCTANDIVLSTSTNGIRWSPVMRIPIDAETSSVDHFIPGLAVDPSTSGEAAHLALTYYYYPNTDCAPDTCELSVGFVHSSDGGATWSVPTTLAGPMKLSWLASTDQGFMVGDYISTSFTGSKAVSVCANASAPTHGLLQEAMFGTVTDVMTASGTANAMSMRFAPVRVRDSGDRMRLAPLRRR